MSSFHDFILQTSLHFFKPSQSFSSGLNILIPLLVSHSLSNSLLIRSLFPSVTRVPLREEKRS